LENAASIALLTNLRKKKAMHMVAVLQTWAEWVTKPPSPKEEYRNKYYSPASREAGFF